MIIPMKFYLYHDIKSIMYKVTRKSRKSREPPHIYLQKCLRITRPLRKPRILYLRGICILHSLRWVFFQSLLTPPALTTV